MFFLIPRISQREKKKECKVYALPSRNSMHGKHPYELLVSCSGHVLLKLPALKTIIH